MNLMMIMMAHQKRVRIAKIERNFAAIIAFRVAKIVTFALRIVPFDKFHSPDE